MANTQDYIDYLNDQIDIAPANSQEELRAAQCLAYLFDAHGLEPTIQEFDVSSTSVLSVGILMVVLFIGALLSGMGSVGLTAVGILFVIGAAALLVMRYMGKDVLGKYGPVARSQNVIAFHGATGELAAKGNRPIVIVAHYDTPHEELFNNPAIAPYQAMLKRASVVCVPVATLFSILQIFSFIPGAARRVLWLVAILASIPLLIWGVSIIARNFMGCTPGANDNKAALAAMLSVLNRVRPIEGEDVPTTGRDLRKPVATSFAYNQDDDGELEQDVQAADADDIIQTEAPSTFGSFEEDGASSFVASSSKGAGFAGRSDVDLVRHGEETLTALGVLPEDCEIVYEAEVGRRLAAPAPSAAFAHETAPAPATHEDFQENSYKADDYNYDFDNAFDLDAGEPLDEDVYHRVSIGEVDEAPAFFEAPRKWAKSIADFFQGLRSKGDDEPEISTYESETPDDVAYEEEYVFESELDGEAAEPAVVEAEETLIVDASELELSGEQESTDTNFEPVEFKPIDEMEAEAEAAQPKGEEGEETAEAESSIEATEPEDAEEEPAEASAEEEDDQPEVGTTEGEAVTEVEAAVNEEEEQPEPGSQTTQFEALFAPTNPDETMAGVVYAPTLAAENRGEAQYEDVQAAAEETTETTEVELVDETEVAAELSSDAEVEASVEVEAELVTGNDAEAEADAELVVEPDAEVDLGATVIAEPIKPSVGMRVPEVGDEDFSAGLEQSGRSSASRRAILSDLPDPSQQEVDPFATDPENKPLSEAQAEDKAPADGATVVMQPSSVRLDTDNTAQPIQDEIEIIAPAPADEIRPRRRRRGFFSFRRKEKTEESSMSDWLGVGDDFDAKKDGRNIGSWDNFEAKDEDNNDDSTTGSWKGGATGNGRFRVIDGKAPEDDALTAAEGEYEAEEEVVEPTSQAKIPSTYEPEDSFVDEQAYEDEAQEENADTEAPSEAELRDAILSMGDDALISHDIWFIAAGASGLGNAGIKAFLAEYRKACRGAFLINLDCIGAGQLTVLTNEGLDNPRRADRRLVRLLNETAGDLHIELDQMPMSWGDTDATPAMRTSMRSATIMGVDENGLPALSCSHDDVPEAIDEHQVDSVVALITELIRRS